MKSCNYTSRQHRPLRPVPGRRGRQFVFCSILCVTALCSAVAQSQTFGTLFTTAEERQYLDYLRQNFLARNQQTGFDIDDAVMSTEISEPEALSLIFHLAGIVNNSEGGRTIWLNDAALAEKDLPSNLSLVTHDGITALKIVAQETNFYLKTGQTLDIESGQLWESFETIEPEASASEYLENIGSSIESSVETATELFTDQAAPEVPNELINIQNLIESLQDLQNSENAR